MRKLDAKLGFYRIWMSFEKFLNTPIDPFNRARELSFSTVYENHGRKIVLLVSLYSPTLHNFSHAFKVINLVFF